MSKDWRNRSASFDAKVALEVPNGEKAAAQLAAPYEVHTGQIQVWKKSLLERAKTKSF